jgi:dTDP-D-glucose 4,6-dehydratase
VYGPHQYPEKVIPKFIHLLQQGRAWYVDTRVGVCQSLPSTIHGNRQHRRGFIYVSDVAEAFDIIFHKRDLGSIYNIGTQFEISSLDVAKQLLKALRLEDDERRVRHCTTLVAFIFFGSF